MPRIVAVTGGTGFLGRHVVAALAARGWRVRLLARREPAATTAFEPEIVLGSLSDPAALERLVDGAEAVLHLAGLIKAARDEPFFSVNRDGTRALAEAVARRAPDAHFVHVSSLAARSPELSAYAASKRAGEDAAFEVLGRARVSVLRPPAIYGPGDRETLTFFQLALGALVPLPSRPAARFALIHAEDAARQLVACVEGRPTGVVQALSDERPAGYAWREILETAATAVGNGRPRFLPVPAALLRGVGGTLGLAARLGAGSGMISAGKIRELLHEDWAVREDERFAPVDAPPRHTLVDGFRGTAAWYREAGWLR